jgi:hypothetical protein
MYCIPGTYMARQSIFTMIKAFLSGLEVNQHGACVYFMIFILNMPYMMNKLS